jgi:hypothetical protein
MFFAMFFSSLCDFHFNFQINMLNIRAKVDFSHAYLFFHAHILDSSFIGGIPKIATHSSP